VSAIFGVTSPLDFKACDGFVAKSDFMDHLHWSDIAGDFALS
jgi:hypothetical protein